MPWHNLSTGGQATMTERIISGLCYVTFGLLGLLYIIISGRSGQSGFFRFHFLQSIVLGILGMLISWSGNIFISLMGGLVGLMGPAIAAPIIGGVNTTLLVVMWLGYILLGYGMLWAFMGKYAEIPFVSNLVYQQMR